MSGIISGELKITINSNVDTCVFEEIEDKIRDLLEQEGIDAVIEDFRTGNIIRTRKEDIEKNSNSPDITARGILTLGEKIWFNDDLRCRLRICGWTKEQQDKLRNAKLVDLTLSNPRDDFVADVVIHISQFTEGDDADEKNKRREKEKQLVNRINRLDKKGMRAALYSISDIGLLEDIVIVGENLEKIIIDRKDFYK